MHGNIKASCCQSNVHMVDQTILSFLTSLHISQEAAQIYFSLLATPPISASAIWKRTHIPKTMVYRRLEELQRHGLVAEHIDAFKKVYTATTADQLALLVASYEQEVQKMKQQLPHITQLLQSHSQTLDPHTKVLF